MSFPVKRRQKFSSNLPIRVNNVLLQNYILRSRLELMNLARFTKRIKENLNSKLEWQNDMSILMSCQMRRISMIVIIIMISGVCWARRLFFVSANKIIRLDQSSTEAYVYGLPVSASASRKRLNVCVGVCIRSLKEKLMSVYVSDRHCRCLPRKKCMSASVAAILVYFYIFRALKICLNWFKRIKVYGRAMKNKTL